MQIVELLLLEMAPYTLKIKYDQKTNLKLSILILTGQERDVTEIKCVWPITMTGNCQKLISSLVISRDSDNWPVKRGR